MTRPSIFALSTQLTHQLQMCGHLAWFSHYRLRVCVVSQLSLGVSVCPLFSCKHFKNVSTYDKHPGLCC